MRLFSDSVLVCGSHDATRQRMESPDADPFPLDSFGDDDSFAFSYVIGGGCGSTSLHFSIPNRLERADNDAPRTMWWLWGGGGGSEKGETYDQAMERSFPSYYEAQCEIPERLTGVRPPPAAMIDYDCGEPVDLSAHLPRDQSVEVPKNIRWRSIARSATTLLSRKRTRTTTVNCEGAAPRFSLKRTRHI